MHSAFQYNQYLLKRQVIALTGTFRIYNPSGVLVLYSQQKILRLKEDIRVFTDESRAQELLYIQARQVIDFAASYDVYDSLSNERIGMLRRKGLSSLVRDNWQVFDSDEQQIGILLEDNFTRAFIRRVLLGSFLPLRYDLLLADIRAASINQHFNLLRYELDLDFIIDPLHNIDRRLGIAAALLLATIEGRQN